MSEEFAIFAALESDVLITREIAHAFTRTALVPKQKIKVQTIPDCKTGTLPPGSTEGAKIKNVVVATGTFAKLFDRRR